MGWKERLSHAENALEQASTRLTQRETEASQAQTRSEELESKLMDVAQAEAALREKIDRTQDTLEESEAKLAEAEKSHRQERAMRKKVVIQITCSVVTY